MVSGNHYIDQELSGRARFPQAGGDGMLTDGTADRHDPHLEPDQGTGAAHEVSVKAVRKTGKTPRGALSPLAEIVRGRVRRRDDGGDGWLDHDLPRACFILECLKTGRQGNATCAVQPRRDSGWVEGL